MSLLLPDSGLLFWMVVAFGIVFVILAKYGFPIIIKMVEELGGEVVRCVFLMELAGLKGREKLNGYDIDSAIIYEGK